MKPPSEKQTDSATLLPERKWMRHDTPHWAAPDSYFFLTICAGDRGGSPLIDHGRPEKILESARYYHDQQQ